MIMKIDVYSDTIQSLKITSKIHIQIVKKIIKFNHLYRIYLKNKMLNSYRYTHLLNVDRQNILYDLILKNCINH